MVENERTMCRLNDDGTITVSIIRTIPQPTGPIREPSKSYTRYAGYWSADDLLPTADEIKQPIEFTRPLEEATNEVILRHAAQFMFPFRRKPIDLDG